MCSGYLHHFPFLSEDLKLKTTNRLAALTLAEQIYCEKKGRLNFGLRPVSITVRELSALYQKERRIDITNIPHQGITPRSFDTMCQHIKYWEDYIKEEGQQQFGIPFVAS